MGKVGEEMKEKEEERLPGEEREGEERVPNHGI